MYRETLVTGCQTGHGLGWLREAVVDLVEMAKRARPQGRVALEGNLAASFATLRLKHVLMALQKVSWQPTSRRLILAASDFGAISDGADAMLIPVLRL
jgi:hypothetical protein